MLRRHSNWLGIGIVREARLATARRAGWRYGCIFLSLIFLSFLGWDPARSDRKMGDRKMSQEHERRGLPDLSAP
jgi:hypothetical protein